ncbi:MAG: SDR family oxidoreductase [Pseudomonadota bacterium]
MDKLFDVSGRVALVTGGSRGIGRMIAEAFVQRGVRTYITARKAEACVATADELSAHGECIALPHDLSDMDGIAALVADLSERESSLDILINNAGAAWGAEFDEFPEHGWDKVMNINVRSVFFLTKELAGLLREAATDERPAKVINIASIDGIRVTDDETYSYGASKAAVIHLTRSMAKRLVRENILVNGIAPGAFASNMNKAARDAPDAVATVVPSGRVGRSGDMAGAALYLASAAGDYVVGQTLVVDGGIASLGMAVANPPSISSLS